MCTTVMIDISDLASHRRADVEQDIWPEGVAEGNCSGDLPMPRVQATIRFAIIQDDPPGDPVMILSAWARGGKKLRRATDTEVRAFGAFAGLTIGNENTSFIPTIKKYMRHFDLVD